jgi:alpha-amylase/alpha-mannosidase (GH57 family)
LTPIKLALLWHQHQPDYRSGPRILLPWVRLHATKDYLEMAQHLEQHPKMRATINLVPSLIRQLEAYRDGTEDELLYIIKKDVSALLPKEKEFILENCFHANYKRMITRSARYSELHDKKESRGEFTEQDYRDLIVLYHLAWTGEFARDEEPYKSLITKDRDFSEEEKDSLITAQQLLINKIIPLHRELLEKGNIEISSTPFYHPILPLLCDSNAARESMLDVTLPEKIFSSTEDAFAQVRRTKEVYEERFGYKVQGIWPSEGSISDAALDVLIEEGITWTASDETVLFHSLNSSSSDANTFADLEKFFPRKYSKNGKEIILFFRDHGLSDRIGFDYASWDAHIAAQDFIRHCKNIRTSILNSFGEEILKDACISIILDGENCWENYHENGKYFLDEFYSALTSTPEIKPVTFSQAISDIKKENNRPISHIVAGSWIQGNFKIWIGHPEKNRAWELLADACSALSSYQIDNAETTEHAHAAHTSLLKAEGSDWFWWYGDDNASAQKHIFDELFRQHLTNVYIHLRLPVPKELFEPIGKYETTGDGGAMHRA